MTFIQQRRLMRENKLNSQPLATWDGIFRFICDVIYCLDKGFTSTMN